MTFFTFSRGEHSVWIYDLTRGASSRITKTYGAFPVWSPDGTRIAFENRNLFWQPVDGSAPPEQLSKSERRQFPACWSPDGKTLIFVQTDTSGSHDIWALPLDGDRKPRPLVQTPANEWDASLSPNGHWLAYSSGESGREEVYVRSYPGLGGKEQISIDGGSEPAWSQSGKELLYIGHSDDPGTAAMFAVDITSGQPFKAGKPRMLFKGPFGDNQVERRFDVTPDGQLFIMCLTANVPPPLKTAEIHVVLN